LPSDYLIRRPTKKDSRGIIDLLISLANFEHLDPPDDASRRRIIRDIFSRQELLNVFLAEEKLSRELVGYALYFYTYSSFLARRTLYLEDIFVLEEHRGRGLGKDLFVRCVQEARKNDCGRMEWAVLTWNENAIDFYEKLGAKRMDQWYAYRLTRESIESEVFQERKGKY
jgi:GNAT superfamily N-acetyltransferase